MQNKNIFVNVYIWIFLASIFGIYSFEVNLRSDLINYEFLLIDYETALISTSLNFSYSEPLFLAFFYIASNIGINIIILSLMIGISYFYATAKFIEKTTGQNHSFFNFLLILLFLTAASKIYPSLLLLKQSLATIFFLFGLIAKSNKNFFLLTISACLFHNMIVPLCLLAIVIRYFGFYTLLLSNLVLIVFLNTDYVIQLDPNLENYTKSQLYIFIDIICIFLILITKSSGSLVSKIFIFLFLVVYISPLDLLAIRYEFLLHIFRISIIYLFIRKLFKINQMQDDNFLILLMMLAYISSSFYTYIFISFKQF